MHVILVPKDILSMRSVTGPILRNLYTLAPLQLRIGKDSHVQDSMTGLNHERENKYI